MSIDKLVVRGAREHNLKDVSIELPRDALIVFTGLSGSGKSSLAFDTIFAEGQRRYVESLSAYARQFLGQRISLMLISSKVYLLPFQLIRSQRTATLVQP
jgi:excinuclease UvrABC ATPase subunit